MSSVGRWSRLISLTASIDQRQRAQAEEVHLQQADALDLLHRPLRDDFVVGPLVERRVLGDRLRRDHHAGGVHRGVARHAFEPAGDREQLLDLRVVLPPAPCSAGFSSSALSSVMSSAAGSASRPCRRPRYGISSTRPTSRTTALRLHRPEGDDLRDVLAAVLPGDVLDHLAAPPLAEIDVDVGQRDALGVEEPLEDQVEVERIDVGDPQAVGHQAAGGRPAARARPESPAPARSG